MIYWVIGVLLFAILIATNIILVKYFVRRKMSSIGKQIMLSDLRAIRAQMNPHFIFNSLNSINSYILKNEPEIASEYLGRFARLMRLVLENSNHEKIALSEELQAMELYIELEQLRFNHQFTYSITVSDNIDQQQVLVQPLIFQPFLENAIWHGLMHKEDGDKKLSMSIDLEEQTMICKIIDNGIGRSSQPSKSEEKRKSYGIKLVKDRLQFLDKNAAITFIDLKDENGKGIGTEVQISFKKIENYTF